MIHRLIILLLIVGCVFGDTIVYQKSKFSGGYKKVVLNNIEYLGVSKDGIHYKKSMGFLGNTYGILKCADVHSILNSSHTEIEYSCDDFTINPTNEKYPQMLKAPANVKGHLGGILIAIGGGVLLLNTEKECNDCDTLDKTNDFIEEIKSTQQIAYFFIMVGGLLITIGA